MKVKLIDTLLYSNIFIGIAALLQTWLYAHLYFGVVHLDLLLYVYAGTQLSYTFLIGFPKKSSEETRDAWILNNKRILLFISLFSCILITYALYHIENRFYLILPSIVVLVYKSTLKNKYYTLRNIPYTKFLVISIVWVYTTQMMNVIIYHSINEISSILLSQQLLFISSLALFFDYKDQKSDHSNNIKTIAQILSLEKLKVLYLFMNVLSLIILILNAEYYLIILLQSFIIAYSYFLFRYVKTSIDSRSFSLKMDGVIVVSSLFYLIINYEKLSVVTEYSLLCK